MGGWSSTGNGGVSLASSTFDLFGSGASSTSTYITVVNPLTSNATFYGLEFNESQHNTYNHNVPGVGGEQRPLLDDAELGRPLGRAGPHGLRGEAELRTQIAVATDGERSLAPR